MAKSVFEQLDAIMKNVSTEVFEKVDAAAYSSAQNAAMKLNRTSPGTGSYREGWRVSRKRQSVRRGSHGKFYNIVHNATDYRLTHLLENSHVIRNANGTYGRTSPGHGQVVHIRPVERQSVKEYIEAVEWALANL